MFDTLDLKGFVVAGFESVTTSLVWIFVELAKRRVDDVLPSSNI